MITWTARKKRSFSRGSNSNRTDTFINNINNCNLVDRGCSGPRLTWSNNRGGFANTLVWLDRALVNPYSRLKFPEATITNLLISYSDHCPVLIVPEGNLNLFPRSNKKAPFRFMAAWFEHPEFVNMVRSAWSLHSTLISNFSHVRDCALNWNKKVFGNIFQKKKRIKARLRGIQMAQERAFSHNLDSLERDLKKDLESVLHQEESLWHQKSRVNWITKGDRNPKFFHLSTIVRRKRNKIDKLKIDGEWVEEPSTLSSHIINNFNNLFKRDDNICLDELRFPPCLKVTQRENNTITGTVSLYEVKKAVFDMMLWKAPGPNGFQPKIFQFFWEELHQNVFLFIKQCFTNWSFPNELNKCFTTLIPKIDNPETINSLRPITLCNVIYEVLTKVIVNRIRPLLKRIVGPSQASFIPGRQTSDNIIITQEIIHTLEKKGAKEGGIIFKIDLEKAYDKISWDFLEKCL